MKRHLLRTLSALLLCLLLAGTVFADFGPKFSVEFQIDGLEGRRCYATLLSKTQFSGPAQVWDGKSPPEDYMLDGMDRKEAAEAFYAFGGYRDPEGFCFLEQVFQVEEGRFEWGYYPPDEFKLLLYFPDTGELTAGKSLERYAFDSAFRCALREDGSLGDFTKTNSLPRQIPSFLLRVAATLLLELLLALPFGYLRRASLPVLIKTNLITQIGLNLALALYAHRSGAPGGLFPAVYLLLELGVLMVEGIVYVKRLPECVPERPGHRRAICYSFLANAASFAAGLGLAHLLPFRF